MAYIGKSPVIGNFVKLDAITAVNGQAAYTMQNGGSNFTDYESVNQFLVSLNGTIQAPTDSFTVSGSTLTFASNLSTGDVIDFIMVFGNSLSAGTPTDATVSKSKLATDVPLAIWQSTIQTSNFTASSNKGYWVNTTSGAITITLPASPNVGDILEFSDYSRTWGTNAVTINTNSLNFQGNTSPNPEYNTNGQSVKIVYSGSTQGWIPTSDDDVTYETPQSYDAEYLVVAGGGGAGNNSNRSAGGGAGGLLTNYGGTAISLLTGNVFTITVGSGGAAGSTSSGSAGNDSVLSGSGITTITAVGGGGGGGNIPTTGGSGGGGADGQSGAAGTVGQGNAGGNGTGGAAAAGGGGGGAGAVGGNSSSSSGGAGGNGSANSITGSSVTYAGGGGGVAENGTGGAGGSGGGGAGNGSSGTAGTANTGGGGGAGHSGSGAGGSGVVILRVATADYSGTTTGSPTVTTDGSDTIIKFTTSGSYTA